MLINEIFKSIQGEGRYQGEPVIFVRLSGCTRNCSFCDTKYHVDQHLMTPKEVASAIRSYSTGCRTVVVTGGEPLLQWIEIKKLRELLPTYAFHLETNGDLLTEILYTDIQDKAFDYICISPKTLNIAKKVNKFIQKRISLSDIKVVTDLDKVGTDMLKYATVVMPLSTYTDKDKKIRQDVWNYCTKHNKLYSARLHVEVWKLTKGK